MTDIITLPPDIAPNSYVDGIRARGIAVADLDDTAVSSVITECLPEFSRFRPVLAELIFHTQSGKQSYTWTEIGDASGQMALLIIWSFGYVADADEFGILLNGIGIDSLTSDYHLPSQKVLEDIKRAACSSRLNGGFQRSVAGGNIYLDPVPDGVSSVYVLYTKPYGSSNDVLAADRDIVLDLVESKASSRIVNELARKSIATYIKTPEYERSVGEQIGYWRKNATEKMTSFKAKCSAGSATGTRS